MKAGTQATEEVSVMHAVRPTLFIALGGTGAEICLRLRRRMLDAWWGDLSAPVKLSHIAELPVAEFLYLDWVNLQYQECPDNYAFVSDELISPNHFFLDNYTRSKLDYYPHIQEWLRPGLVDVWIDESERRANFNQSTPIPRPLTRLFFFDSYRNIRDQVLQKLQALRFNVSNSSAMRRFGLESDGRTRVVVVASTAGGTGSGTFLDMGYLCRYWVKQLRANANVDLVLMLPSGYAKGGKERIEANTYAALMELETCMTEPNRFVTRWDQDEKYLELENKPYDDVFLLDTSNLALKAADDVEDVYEMAASVLSANFTHPEFGERAHAIRIAKARHKFSPYEMQFPPPYGAVLLSKAYSSFGFSELDTQLDVRRNVRLHRQVINEFPHVAADTQSENPLFEALRAHRNRALLFSDLLSLAMPWVKANLDGDFKVSPDQFSCQIWVADAETFKREFMEELRRAVPTQSKITVEHLNVFESGVRGRLMCYVELSGFPLAAFTQINDWRNCYRSASKHVPVHTHRDVSLFIEPIQRSATELNALSEDFKLFLQAVQFGALRRYDEEGGVYKVEVKERVWQAIGNERTIRQKGFEEGIARKAIRSQISAQEEQLNSPYQLAALAALNGHFVYGVYQLKTVKDEEGRDHDVQGFASAVAELLSKEAEEKFRRMAGGKIDTERVINALEERLSEWTEEIKGSEDDAYASEVGTEHTPKRTIKPDVFFDAAKMEAFAGVGEDRSARVAPPGGVSRSPPASYHIAIGGQASGPYSVSQLQQMVSTSQFARETLVWREGLAGWLPAGQVPDLAFVFGPAPLPGMAPGLPPLPPQP